MSTSNNLPKPKTNHCGNNMVNMNKYNLEVENYVRPRSTFSYDLKNNKFVSLNLTFELEE